MESLESALEDHSLHASHIRHGIYLGDLYDAYHVLLDGEPGDIRAVLNLIDMSGGEPEYPPIPAGIVYCNLPLIDFQYCDPRNWHEAADFIDRQKDGVLVHCLAGISRSPTAVLAYLVKHEKLSAWRGMRLMRQARPQVRPAPQIMRSFKEFRKSLRWA